LRDLNPGFRFGQRSLDFFQRLLAVAPGPSLVCQGSAYIKPPVMCD
jgi:hypothetical protein